jgi:hypothetical protein
MIMLKEECISILLLEHEIPDLNKQRRSRWLIVAHYKKQKRNTFTWNFKYNCIPDT